MITQLQNSWRFRVLLGCLAGAAAAACGGREVTVPTSASALPAVGHETAPAEPAPPAPAEPAPSATPPPPIPIVSAPGAIVTGVGDIAECGGPGAGLTARLLTGTIITLGDHAYPHGSKDDFRNCYDPYWGPVKDRTFPTPGNHDYETDNAVPYFEYFGPRVRGPEYEGYYSYTLGGWRILSLNSELPRAPMSRQIAWIAAELARNPSECSLAYFHRPLFSSGIYGTARMRDLWEPLYRAGVDLVLNGHEHFYERFAPQNPIGSPDPAFGITQLTVGTGGSRLFEAGARAPNSERVIAALGIIRLSLRATDYDWEFVPADARGGTDVGSRGCHARPPTK